MLTLSVITVSIHVAAGHKTSTRLSVQAKYFFFLNGQVDFPKCPPNGMRRINLFFIACLDFLTEPGFPLISVSFWT